jgi:hypothetical protein
LFSRAKAGRIYVIAAIRAKELSNVCFLIFNQIQHRNAFLDLQAISNLLIMDENPHRTEEHPLSEKQGNTDESKLSTAVAAIADPKFPLPALTDKSSTLRCILSFGTLATLLATSIVGAWYLDVTMLQSEQPIVVLSVAFFAVLGALFFTGTVWIDWFELVMGYWWLSMPIAAAAGLVLVMNQEQSTGIQESA